MNRQHKIAFRFWPLIGTSGLMLVLCIPFLSHTVYSLVRKQTIKRDVKRIILRGIPDKDLVYFTFHQQEADDKVIWKEEGEFMMNGFMYDVVKVQIDGDSIRYACWPDVRESALHQHWKKQYQEVARHDPLQHQHKKKVLDFQKLLICSSLSICPENISVFREKEIFTILPTLLTTYLSLQKPPPRLSSKV